MKTKQISVNGMSCNNCAETVKITLENMAGVKQVQVSLEDKTVLIDFEENQINLKEIKGKIIEVGFEAL